MSTTKNVSNPTWGEKGCSFPHIYSSSARCLKQIWKVGKVGKAGKADKVGKVGM